MFMCASGILRLANAWTEHTHTDYGLNHACFMEQFRGGFIGHIHAGFFWLSAICRLLLWTSFRVDLCAIFMIGHFQDDFYKFSNECSALSVHISFFFCFQVGGVV